MAVVPIRIVGDPVLHTATTPIPVGPDGSLPAELAELITDLFDTMDAANGVGLAANQIGVSKRVFVYDCADERGLTSRRRGVVVNPVLETSDVPAGAINLVTGKRDPLSRVMAEHDDVDAVWFVGSQEGATAIERASAGNLKRTWTEWTGREWLDPRVGEGREFLRRAVQVKNIWIPYGE